MIDGKAAVMITSTLAGAFSFWVAIYGWGKWLERPRRPALLPDNDARLRGIEQALDSIAIEVERIGEGQRFTTRLLGDRQREDPAALPAPASYRPVVTPH